MTTDSVELVCDIEIHTELNTDIQTTGRIVGRTIGIANGGGDGVSWSAASRSVMRAVDIVHTGEHIIQTGKNGQAARSIGICFGVRA